MIAELLNERHVPALTLTSADAWPAMRQAYQELLCREEYGTPVPEPEECHFEAVTDSAGKRYCAGKAKRYRVTASGKVNGAPFSFPFWAVLPSKPGKYPFFVLNDFDDTIPSKYAPVEEIIDNGFALFSVCYENVTSDDGDFANGLAAALYPDPAQRAGDAPGKIQMWAWANRRVLDYALSLDNIDPAGAAVIGHSRLGKTALVTGMLDSRFQFVISSCAGCSGDAMTRNKLGEHVSDITNRFPYWFCENYKAYAGQEDAMPFDQHTLLATIAPRHLLIGAALADEWADPASQYLSCHAAAPVWELLGAPGFAAPDRLPAAGDNFDDGSICYHLREGTHYLSRQDWQTYMSTVRKHLGR